MGMRRRRSARRVGHRFVLPCCFGAVITLTRALLRSQVWPRTLHFVAIGKGRRRFPVSPLWQKGRVVRGAGPAGLVPCSVVTGMAVALRSGETRLELTAKSL